MDGANVYIYIFIQRISLEITITIIVIIIDHHDKAISVLFVASRIKEEEEEEKMEQGEKNIKMSGLDFFV